MTDYSLFSGVALPAGATFADASGRTLGVEFYVTSTTWVKAISWYRVNTSQAAPTVGAIYVVSTGLKVTGTDVTFPAGTGWLTGTLTTPIALTPNTRYRAAGVAPGTNLPGQSNYWSTGVGSTDVVNGPLTGPSAANATGNLQGSYNLGSTLTFPNTSNTSRARYGIDVTVTDVDPNPGTSYSRTVTDAGAAVDTTALARSVAQAITDAAGAVDTFALASGVAQTVTDQALAADTATRSAAYAPALADAAGAADAQTSIRELNVNPIDTVGATDAPESTVDYQRFWVEPAAVADSVARSNDSARDATDTVAAADVTEQAQNFAATVTDSVDAADETEFQSGALSEVVDAIDVGDAVEVESEYAPTLTDPAGAADLVALEAGFTQEFVETVAVADAAGALVDHRDNITETIGATDQIAVVVHSTPVITDALGAIDTLTQGLPASRQVVDTAHTVDSVDVNTVGRVTTPADEAVATDEAVVLGRSVSTPVPVAIETAIASVAPRVAQANVPEAAETDTVEVPRPTGSYPTEQAGDWELTFTPIVLVDDGEFAVAINDEDRTPTYTLMADWNRNGLYDHPLSDLTSLVEEVTVSRALSGTLPVEVGLVEGYSTAELAVRLAGEIPADAFEALADRRNLVVNPSFETSTAGWSSNAYAPDTLPREQGPFARPSGGWYAYGLRSSAGDLTIYPSGLSVVTPGLRYTGSIYVNRDGVNNVRLDLDWYSGGTFLTSTFGAVHNPPTGTWTRLITSETAPAGATRCRIYVRFIDQAVNFYVRLDAASLEQSSSTVAGPYFDGSSTGAIWEGTAHNSTSLLQGAQQLARVSGREFDVVDAFAPYRPDSPLYGRPVLQTPIYLETGFLADDGPRVARRFTGTVTQIHPESASRFVELRAIDPVNRLRSAVTLSGVAMYESILALRGSDQYRSRINSQWLIDHALRRNSIYTSPPARTDAVLSVTGHGSMIPEVGWGGAPEEYYPTYRGEMWQAGRFGGALCTIGGPIGRWWLTDEVTAASGTGFGFSQWMGLYPAGGAAGQYFSMDLTTNASWFINFGVDTAGRPYLGSLQTGQAEVRATPSGFAVPAVGTWAFVGVHVVFAATQMTVRFRINQTTYTSTVTIGSRPGNWKPGVYMNYAWRPPFQNFQLWKGATVPTTPWQGEDPGWVPQADLDPGVNELTGVPELIGVDSWELIKTITEAEGSIFQFDEFGRPQFRTTKGDQWYGRTKTVKEIVSADRNLADLVSTTDESTIRNVINIKTKTQLISDWQDFYSSPDVDAFTVPGNTTSYFEIELPSAAYELPPTLSTFGARTYEPWRWNSIGGTGFIFFFSDGFGVDNWQESSKFPNLQRYIRCQLTRADQPQTLVGTNIYIRLVRLSPWLAQVVISNQNAYPVRFATPAIVDPTTGTYNSMGEPALIIPARLVTAGPERLETYTDNTSVATYGASPFDVGASDDVWRQTPQGLRALATEVLRNTASPVPVLDAVDVPHDPRRKLADRIILRDPDGLGEVTASIVGLSQTYSSQGTRDQITVRPIAPPGSTL